MATITEENGLGDPTNHQKGDTPLTELAAGKKAEQQGQEPVQLDIVINNVVSSFSVRCHLNLRQIALNGTNVEYKRENAMITMKIRRPYTTASMWSSGKITCTGATSEEFAKVAARKFARTLQKLGFKTRFGNYRVVNVLGTCTMPFAIRIIQFSTDHRENASYEPELHPGVTYKIKEPKATLKIFSTGSITVTAPCVNNVQAAIEQIFPILYEYRKETQETDDKRDSHSSGVPQFRSSTNRKKKPKPPPAKRPRIHLEKDDDDDFGFMSNSDDQDADSDQSWD